LLGKENGFETPKPTRLLRHFIQMATKNDGSDIVMDFFAGTGTLGDAVLQQNHDDGGNRRFVLVQLPEPTTSREFPTIASIAKRRLTGSIEALKKRAGDELDLANGTRFDLGFRVFKLTSSNFKIWDGEVVPSDPEKLIEQIRLFADNVVPGRPQEAILYELILKAGLPLTAEIKTRELHGATVYLVAGGLLLICLADPIERDVLRAIVDLKPQRVLCLDHAFRGNDKDKVNALLEMRSHGIEFRTV
jgi:adenine-specific DNA-methyltransferase